MEDNEPWCIRTIKSEIEGMKKYEEHDLDFEVRGDVVYMIHDNNHQKHWFETLEEARHHALRYFDKTDVYIRIHELGTTEAVHDKDESTVEGFLREPFVYIDSLMLQYRIHNGCSKEKAFRDAFDVWQLFGAEEHRDALRYLGKYPDEGHRLERKIQQYYHLTEHQYDSFDEYVDTLYLR